MLYLGILFTNLDKPAIRTSWRKNGDSSCHFINIDSCSSGRVLGQKHDSKRHFAKSSGRGTTR
jgi:hypothetical protein